MITREINNDYYPFGMTVPNRNYSSSSYRYGYQGSEKDDEVKGNGNSYTTHFRQLDPRVGRWLSRDPKVTAFESPYSSMSNNPIIYNDILGDTIRYQGSRLFKFRKKTQIFFQSIFGTKEVKGIIKELKTNKHDVVIRQIKPRKNGSYVSPSASPKAFEEHMKQLDGLDIPYVDPFVSDSKSIKALKEYNNIRANITSTAPRLFAEKGVGDDVIVRLHNKSKKINPLSKVDGENPKVKDTNTLTVFHELFHAYRIILGIMKVEGNDSMPEEIKAVQFINRNMRNKKNRRRMYGETVVPKINQK